MNHFLAEVIGAVAMVTIAIDQFEKTPTRGNQYLLTL